MSVFALYMLCTLPLSQFRLFWNLPCKPKQKVCISQSSLQLFFFHNSPSLQPASCCYLHQRKLTQDLFFFYLFLPLLIFQLSSYPMLSPDPGSMGWAHASIAPPACWRPLAAAGRRSGNSTRTPWPPRREAQWPWGPSIPLPDSVSWCSAVLYPPSWDHHQEYVAVLFSQSYWSENVNSEFFWMAQFHFIITTLPAFHYFSSVCFCFFL